MEHLLRIQLLSDACFSGGKSFAGEVDTDIEHEETTGLPLIRGRTLKGLLVEEGAMILKTLLKEIPAKPWQDAARKLFGAPGMSSRSKVTIGDALLPEPLRRAALEAISREGHPLSPHQLLGSLTDIRYQTKIDFDTGAPQAHTLRATRVALKDLIWFAPLSGTDDLDPDEKALFSACVLATRRGGLNRNRGWGKMSLRILDDTYVDVTADWIAPLKT